jgi:hypothetical protein
VCRYDMEVWLKTDETEEAISALEMVAEQSVRMQEDTYRWKWVILAIHNALQGFMVLALRGGNGLRPLRNDIAAAWLKAYREGKDPPQEKLDSFLNLYKKIKSERMLFYVHSKKFLPKDRQESSIKKLNSLRNDFIHFLPRMWVLEVGGLPQICLDCLDVIQFLGSESGNIFWRNEIHQRRAQQALSISRDAFERRGKLPSNPTLQTDR